MELVGALTPRGDRNHTDHAAMVTRQLDRQSIKRRGHPTDIAAAVDFLTCPEAGFITGQCLTVDGGWCMT